MRDFPIKVFTLCSFILSGSAFAVDNSISAAKDSVLTMSVASVANYDPILTQDVESYVPNNIYWDVGGSLPVTVTAAQSFYGEVGPSLVNNSYSFTVDYALSDSKNPALGSKTFKLFLNPEKCTIDDVQSLSFSTPDLDYKVTADYVTRTTDPKSITCDIKVTASTPAPVTKAIVNIHNQKATQ